MEPIRIFLLDDHEVVRRGVADLLEVEADLAVVGEAGSVTEAMVRIPATRPDLAVVDVRLPDGSGVEACRELRDRTPATVFLMLTAYADDEALFEAIMAGASGKNLLDPALTPRVLERIRSGRKGDDRLTALSDQELRILELIGEGMTNRQIGDRLHLAEKTVKNYVSSLLAKLGMERRTQAAAFVTRVHVAQGH